MEPFSEKPIQIYEPQFIRILSLVFDQTLARNITHLALSKFGGRLFRNNINCNCDTFI